MSAPSLSLRFFLLLVPVVFLSHCVGAMILEALPVVPRPMDAALEAALVTALSFPVLYILTLRPLLREIQERRRAEAQLRLQSAALETSSSGIVITDPRGAILWTNPAFLQVTGYTLAEAVGQHTRVLKSGLQDREFYREIWQTIGAGQVWRGELVNRRKDGTLYDEEMIITPLRLDGEAITHFIASKRDISQRKRAERTIRQQAALLDIAHDAITVRDLEGRLLFWNKGAERLYGWAATEVLGRKVCELLYAPGEQAAGERAQESACQQGVWRGELEQVTREGQRLTVESRFTLVRDEAGQPTSLLCVSTDMTQKKALEKQCLRAQRMESIGTLAAGIAHDLNNILAPISMAGQLLRNAPLNEGQKRLLDTIEASARRGADVVRQVLTFGRGIEGQHVPLPPKYLIREIEKLVRETFPKSITFEAEVPKNLWTVAGDATQLHQVLLNLCVNARDAMPEGGRLQITAHNLELAQPRPTIFADGKAGRHVLLQVADTGQGIPPHLLEKIFEPFFTTKPVGQGTGLGLATVLGIVRSHGGFLDVESRVGSGTVFRLYLPALPGPAPARVADQQASVFRGAGQRILVVDDEPNMRSVTERTLVASGYTVELAANGKEALERLRDGSGPFDALLTDVMMPVMDGVTLVRVLRQAQPAMPVIVCTGWGQASVQGTLRDLGVRSFLEKPYAAEQLLEALQQLLAAPAAPSLPPLELQTQPG